MKSSIKYNKAAADNSDVTSIDRKLYGAAFVLMVVVAFLVCSTGGTRNSVFAFWLAYIPSVVAICFRAKRGLYITAGFGLFFSVVGLFYFIDVEISKEHQFSNLVLFILVLIVQFASIVLLEFESQDRYPTGPGTSQGSGPGSPGVLIQSEVNELTQGKS